MSEVASALVGTAHVYAVDLPGHGRSDWSEGGYSLADDVDAISPFISDVSGQGSVLVGFSIGALVAFGVAERLPHLIAGVAALEPPLIARNTTFADYSYSPAHTWIQWVDEVIGDGPPPSDAEARFVAMNPGTSEADARQVMADLACLDPRTTQRIVEGRMFEQFELTDTFGALSCPALLLAGETELGGLVRDEDLELFSTHVATGRAERIPGAGHGIIWDAPAETVTARLIEWLRTL